MKALVVMVAAVMLSGFSVYQEDPIDGIWTGIYRTDNLREKVVVKFVSQNQMELYNGEVIESNKFTGTYKLQGDSVLIFTYRTSDGRQYTMQGHINKRKNYVDGVWTTADKQSGSFYLKKEKIREMYIQP